MTKAHARWKRWAEKHPEANKERSRKKAAAYRKNNPGKVNASAANYRARKEKRTPKWLTKQHLKDIKQFYLDAEYLSNYTQTPFEVDHIVPLKGRHISGLHVPWNLQILTEQENVSKSNSSINLKRRYQ